MLELIDVTKKFSIFTAVDNVSFNAKPSEIVGYLGPNGAGKSTTIKILAGLLEKTGGHIFYKGEDISKDLFSFKKKLGYVPEQSEIYPHLSAYDYLLLVGRLRRIPESLLNKKIERFMELFSLSSDMHTAVSSYSKGMIQKVLIAAALLHNPEILLLDEPLSGLDVTTGLILKDLVQKLSKEGKIIIYSSHILEVVEKICSRVIIIHKGHIVANDSVENLQNLMELPTLVDIFNQLVDQDNTEDIAKGIIETMNLSV
ncbi:MAG: ABC transporter ATP-binding protein [Candidatus Aminicenantes bacterium]|nr:ABC transporter ATP-binding protein [Candidatus Aminicenantes bacterium]